MKTSKKIFIGLSVLLALVSIFFFSPKKALAASGWSQQQLSQATYKLNTDGSITMTIPSIVQQLPGLEETQTWSPNNSGTATSVTYHTVNTLSEFCSSGSLVINKNQLQQDPAKGVIKFTYHYANSGTGTCLSYQANINVSNTLGPASIKHGNDTYYPIGLRPTPYYGKGVAPDNHTDANKCYGGSILVLTESGGTDGTLYDVDNSGPSIGPLDTVAPGIPNPKHCYLTSLGQAVSVDGNGNATDTEPADSGTKNSCEGNNNSGLEWILCGVLRTIDKVVFSETKVIENQLNFDTDKFLNNSVHVSWGIIKNIATIILVITMLIMVISQAVGSALLDAYTVKKLLPKLVAAVIIMQISWPLLIWVISLANDAGHGVRDLLAAPFGGTEALNLDKLLGNVGGIGAHLTIEAGLFATIAGVAAFSGLTIFGWIFIAASVFLAVVVGLLLLFLRQLLIIMSVILVPLALVLWILPGTQNYWKLWKDNFIKLLMLFPLIMALIYSGRVFASIAGKTNGGGGEAVLAVMAILLGYFGPYFLLPKAFSWGGQVFGAMSGAVMKLSNSAVRAPSKYALSMAKENRQERARLRANRLSESPIENRSKWDTLLAGGYNRLREGNKRGQIGAREMAFNRTLAEGQKATREGMAATLLGEGVGSWQHGPSKDEHDEVIKAQVDDAGNYTAENQQAGYVKNKLDFHQAMLEGKEYFGIKPTEAMAGHSFDELARLGDPDRIRAARESSSVPEHVWAQSIERNFPRLNEIMRDYTLAPDLSKLNPRQFATQDVDTAKELLRQVEGSYVTERGTGQKVDLSPEDAAESKARAIKLAQEIRSNELLWADLGNDHRTVVDQLAALKDPNEVAIVPSRQRGGDPEVILPDGASLAHPEAQSNVTKALFSEDPRQRNAVIAETAKMLTQPAHSAQYEVLLKDLASKSGASEQAAAMYNSLVQDFNHYVDSTVSSTEQQLLAEGASPEDIQTGVAAARASAETLKARLPKMATGPDDTPHVAGVSDPTAGEVKIEHKRA